MFEKEIRFVIDELSGARDRGVSSLEFVAAVIDRWGVHENQDTRYQVATLQRVKDEVQSIIRGMKKKSDLPKDQRDLFDYDHLQSLYVVDVSGDSQVIPLELMSVEQLRQKAEEHRQQGRGHLTHAEEIERYIEEYFDVDEVTDKALSMEQ